MSRVANSPVVVPSGVDVKLDGKNVVVEGGLGRLAFVLNESVDIVFSEGSLKLSWNDQIKGAKAQAGTARASINNMVQGVSQGFLKKMLLVGVGYRAQVKENILTLALGYSNPVEYIIPEDISIEVPVQTEILIKGRDKQKVGQVASEIRALRPPEPYKGKGVRISDEYVARKEAKKK